MFWPFNRKKKTEKVMSDLEEVFTVPVHPGGFYTSGYHGSIEGHLRVVEAIKKREDAMAKDREMEDERRRMKKAMDDYGVTEALLATAALSGYEAMQDTSPSSSDPSSYSGGGGDYGGGGSSGSWDSGSSSDSSSSYDSGSYDSGGSSDSGSY